MPSAESRLKLAACIAGSGAACFPGGREVPAGSGTLRPSFPSRTCPGQRGQETAHSCSDTHGDVSEPGLCLAAGASAGGRWSSSPGRRSPSPSSGRCGETPRARQVADTGAGAGGRGPGAGVARPGSGARLTVVTRKQHPRVPGAVGGLPGARDGSSLEGEAPLPGPTCCPSALWVGVAAYGFVGAHVWTGASAKLWVCNIPHKEKRSSQVPLK